LHIRFSKILGFCGLFALAMGCSVTKHLPQDAVLLQKNEILVNGEHAVDSVKNIIQPKPNKRFLSIPFGLLLYQSANDSAGVSFDRWLKKKPNRIRRMESLWSAKQVKKLRDYKTGLQDWKKRTGEPPVFTDSLSRASNAQKLNAFFSNEGYFNSVVKTATDTKKQKALVNYHVTTNAPYFLDSIQVNIQSPVLDSIYRETASKSALQRGNRFRTMDFEKERNRLFTLFRNAGVFPFQLNAIDFSVRIDSSGVDYRLPVQLSIRNFIENQEGNAVEKEYQISRMNKVKVFVSKAGNTGNETYDSIGSYDGLALYSQGKMRYNSRLLREAISFKTNEPYSDLSRSKTLQQLTRLQSFDYPTIRYSYANDKETLLDASIYLMPKERYALDFGLDLTQSNIIKRGVAFSSGLSALNVFGGAETLEFGARGSVGRSADVAITEFAFDVQLRAPQFLLPFVKTLNRQEISPQTVFRVGSAVQENIGLDKQSFTGTIQYQWNPKKNRRWTFSLFDIEFVNNQNKENYFGVYTNAYGVLNQTTSVQIRHTFKMTT
jgi:hypothetical protein